MAKRRLSTFCTTLNPTKTYLPLSALNCPLSTTFLYSAPSYASPWLSRFSLNLWYISARLFHIFRKLSFSFELSKSITLKNLSMALFCSGVNSMVVSSSWKALMFENTASASAMFLSMSSKSAIISCPHP